MEDDVPVVQSFDGRLLMIGFGCIGRGVLPLLLRHLTLPSGRISVLAADDEGAALARACGVRHERLPVTADTLREVVAPRLADGDFLLNLSVDVASTALMAVARERGALYLDTCTEPWSGGYVDATLPPAMRTNHALREAALAQRTSEPAPTAVLTHGANPGLVSHLVKQALLDLGRADGRLAEAPRDRWGWAALARRLGVRAIHVAERDTQLGARRKQPGEFVNTWSVDGFVSEACQPAELGWGSHERTLPADAARHAAGSQASIYLLRPGGSTRVRSWTPRAGPMHGFLVTHAESISIADFLTLRDPDVPPDAEPPAYRPTVLYAYHPCDDAVLSLHELAGRNWRLQERRRVLKEDIDDGSDELGVLLLGPGLGRDGGAGGYWYGSRLSIAQARAACPHNSATSLQVTAAVMAGVVWALRHPREGVVEPDEMPHDEILALARPYLGEVVGVHTDWTPLADRGRLFDEPLDHDDPWQFGNFRVL